jgi:hypothetical protein
MLCYIICVYTNINKINTKVFADNVCKDQVKAQLRALTKKLIGSISTIMTKRRSSEGFWLQKPRSGRSHKSIVKMEPML